MLEKLDLGLALTKEEYQKRMPPLQRRLHRLQRECAEVQLASAVIFEGWDAAGKGTSIRKLTQRLEPRAFKLHSITPPRTFEKHLPWLWRFWAKIPNWGEMAIFDRSWYGRVLVERVEKLTSEPEWRRAYADINSFERALAEDRYVLVKFFLHIDKKTQKKRFKKLESDPLTRWQVQEEDWRHHRTYGEYLIAIEEMLERTETEWAPWTVVEARDRRWMRVKIFEALAARLEEALAVRKRAAAEAKEKRGASPGKDPAAEAVSSAAPTTPTLGTVDMDRRLERPEYRKTLLPLQLELRELAYRLYVEQRSMVVVYEGWDAGGKGGNIRRVTERLDPRGYEVYSIAAPKGEDWTHHYLWRFWRRLKAPQEKQILVFDRSWYGRVLVERVEGFAKPHEWKRAYREINDFERQLLDTGTILVKFWIHIDEQEQLRRFEARQKTPHKRWKITDEDWRNREKWDAYVAAVNDMLLKTSTLRAPWTIVEGNDKLYARVKTLRTLVEVLQGELGKKGKK